MLSRCRPLLGTFVEITADCEASIEAGFQAVAEVHALMSAHEPESDISRINRTAHVRPVTVDARTAKVLEGAIHWGRNSQGIFDVVRAGAAALASGAIPRHAGQPLPSGADWRCIELRGQVVRLSELECIDLGGIAKGFAVDEAIAAMKKAGGVAGLVNAGGDLAGFGVAPWPIQVVDPTRRCAVANVAIQNGALATSGLLPGGKSDHLLGRATGLVSATVCAPSAMDADALTKIVLSGYPDTANCLRLAGAEALVVRADGSVHSVEQAKRAA